MALTTQKSVHNTALSEINITPLVDVILVLLIIFMVTAPLLSQGLDVQLPVASAPALERSEEDVMLTIDKAGKIFLQDEKTPYRLEELQEKIGAIFERREKKQILIRADEDVPYGTVVKAISLIKEAGIERVGMITEEAKPAAPPPAPEKTPGKAPSKKRPS
ncbi:MAG TPA: protein TolR [bacterium]|nr:protein TolR [bacterium]